MRIVIDFVGGAWRWSLLVDGVEVSYGAAISLRVCQDDVADAIFHEYDRVDRIQDFFKDCV